MSSVEPDTRSGRPRAINQAACVGCIIVVWGYLFVCRMWTLSRVALSSLSTIDSYTLMPGPPVTSSAPREVGRLWEDVCFRAQLSVRDFAHYTPEHMQRPILLFAFPREMPSSLVLDPEVTAVFK